MFHRKKEHIEKSGCVNQQEGAYQIFTKKQDGSYVLTNGPFHRKFLDGYFPYHVTLIINYPDNKLKYNASKPIEQNGFNVTQQSDRLLIDTIFSGTLTTEILFR